MLDDHAVGAAIERLKQMRGVGRGGTDEHGHAAGAGRQDSDIEHRAAKRRVLGVENERVERGMGKHFDDGRMRRLAQVAARRSPLRRRSRNAVMRFAF